MSPGLPDRSALGLKGADGLGLEVASARFGRLVGAFGLKGRIFFFDGLGITFWHRPLVRSDALGLQCDAFGHILAQKRWFSDVLSLKFNLWDEVVRTQKFQLRLSTRPMP